MSRKDDKTPVVEENILSVPMEEVMHMSMIPYAEHVIMDRAIPRVEDGMKPVQRRTNWASPRTRRTANAPVSWATA